jgi:osmotically inducible protein OsmC
MIRNAIAVWKDTLEDGTGTVSTQSGAFKNMNYGFRSRYGNNFGTNPEEIIAAAHTGCFTMKLSFVLNEKGFNAESIQTNCNISHEMGSITGSHLTVEARVPGISEQEFQHAVKNAEQSCPVSKMLNIKISSDAKLVA